MARKHKWSTAVIALIGAFGLMLATAGSASAGIYKTSSYVRANYTGIQVTAVERGDVITVCDTKANGYAARMQVSSRGVYYEKVVRAGSGSCITASASNGYNLPENRNVTVTLNGENCTCWHQFTFYNNH